MSVLGVLALGSAAAMALAAGDPIEACRAAHAGDSAAHIACLEDALRARADAAVPIDATPASEPPVAVAVPAPPPAPVPAPVPAAAAAGTAATAATADAPVPAPSGLGAEQAKARQRDPDKPADQAAVTVVGVKYTLSGLGVFSMADGQIWMETVASPDRVRLKPDRQYAGRIERGTIGGYRMYLDDVRWMFKVERLK